jgi:hypothetical protein
MDSLIFWPISNPSSQQLLALLNRGSGGRHGGQVWHSESVTRRTSANPSEIRHAMTKFGPFWPWQVVHVAGCMYAFSDTPKKPSISSKSVWDPGGRGRMSSTLAYHRLNDVFPGRPEGKWHFKMWPHLVNKAAIGANLQTGNEQTITGAPV